MRRRALTVVCLIMTLSAASAQTSWPDQREGRFSIKDFGFASGEVLAGLKLMERARKAGANDRLWASEAVIDHDPTPYLSRIKVRLIGVNFAANEVNPPELVVTEQAIGRIPGARRVLVPAGPKTHGHFTYMQAAPWKGHLADLMHPQQ